MDGWRWEVGGHGGGRIRERERGGGGGVRGGWVKKYINGAAVSS